MILKKLKDFLENHLTTLLLENTSNTKVALFIVQVILNEVELLERQLTE